MRRLLPASLLIVLAACSGVTGDPNTVELTLARESCPTCSIQVDSVAFLGHPDDTVLISQSVLPTVDSRRRFYLPAADGNRVQVFDSAGRAMLIFGKAGKGPGEFFGIAEILAAAGDTLFVIDDNGMHVISPSYEHLYQYSGQFESMMQRSTAITDGRLLRLGPGHSFTLTSTAGTTTPTVQLQSVDTTRICPECVFRIFSPASGGQSIWSWTMDQYVISRHGLDGTLEQRITRELTWFPPWPIERIGFDAPVDVIQELTKPRFLGVRQDADGLLWSHVVRGNPAAAAATAAAIESPEQMAALIGMLSLHVEVIDPVKRQLITSTEVRNMGMPISNELTALYVVDRFGDVAWKIVRFRLHRR